MPFVLRWLLLWAGLLAIFLLYACVGYTPGPMPEGAAPYGCKGDDRLWTLGYAKNLQLVPRVSAPWKEWAGGIPVTLATLPASVAAPDTLVAWMRAFKGQEFPGVLLGYDRLDGGTVSEQELYQLDGAECAFAYPLPPAPVPPGRVRILFWRQRQ